MVVSSFLVIGNSNCQHLPITIIVQQLAILSSFYQYADRRRKVPFSNPITMIERSPIEAYAGAVALSEDHVQAALARIDQSTLIGQRNYTLLLVLFNTGGGVGGG